MGSPVVIMTGERGPRDAAQHPTGPRMPPRDWMGPECQQSQN